jgi:hypothetical protein
LSRSQNGWGDSTIEILDQAIKQVGSTSAAIAAIIEEAQFDIIKIPDLTANMGSKEYRDRLHTRFTSSVAAKSIIRSLLMDTNEEWERVTANFTGMPDVLMAYLLIVSGAADIPATRMLGQSPAGLSATGESDTRNYYDRIASDQKTEATPVLSRLDEVLIRSTFGSRNPDIYYDWRPLWQLTEKEQVELEKSKAETYKVDVDTGLVDPDALRTGRENQLVQSGFYPGFAEALDDAAAVREQAEIDAAQVDPDDPGVSAIGDKRALALRRHIAQVAKRVIADAKPRSLYVRRDVINGAEIIEWAKTQGFASTLPVDELHVTIAYSRAAVDWIKVGEAYQVMSAATPREHRQGYMHIKPGGPRVVEPLGLQGAIVLMFASSELCWRHEDIKRMGASWDYGDDYQPHVTITYQAQGMVVETVEPYRGEIILGPEIFEEVADGVSASLIEVPQAAE